MNLVELGHTRWILSEIQRSGIFHDATGMNTYIRQPTYGGEVSSMRRRGIREKRTGISLGHGHGALSQDENREDGSGDELDKHGRLNCDSS